MNYKKYVRAVQLWLGLILLVTQSYAGGISVDAGLTPAENRWIVRVQARQMSMSSQNILPAVSMKTNATVVMAAYGLRPNVTLIGMQAWMNRDMVMMGNSQVSSGFADLNLLLKYLVYRNNSRTSTLGVAATTKLTLPTGDDSISDEYWSLTPGLYLSYRLDTWAFDASTTYRIQSLFNDSEIELERGWEFNVDAALARQYSVGSFRNVAIAPVLESNLLVRRADYAVGDSSPGKSSLLFLSPGLKWTYNSLILEGLVQIPVWEDLPEGSLQNDLRGQLGLRFMF
ncbi:MAG: transporter [Candidatus Marinimicrobia bacterium]|nr:transporter [Candidatus Neomarinimicrobiota bacterium]